MQTPEHSRSSRLWVALASLELSAGVARGHGWEQLVLGQSGQWPCLLGEDKKECLLPFSPGVSCFDGLSLRKPLRASVQPGLFFLVYMAWYF